MVIGEGKQPTRWSLEVLKAKDRTAGAVTAQPQGLYLVHVDYPAMYGFPEFTGVPFMLDTSDSD